MRSWPDAAEQLRPRDPPFNGWRRCAGRTRSASAERDSRGSWQLAAFGSLTSSRPHPVRTEPEGAGASARPSRIRSGAGRPPARAVPDQLGQDRGRPERAPAQRTDRTPARLKRSAFERERYETAQLYGPCGEMPGERVAPRLSLFGGTATSRSDRLRGWRIQWRACCGGFSGGRLAWRKPASAAGSSARAGGLAGWRGRNGARGNGDSRRSSE
jgi:hypothetical protein